MANSIIYFQDYTEASDAITLTSTDNYSLTNYDGTPRTHPGQSVSQLPSGSWLRFKSTIPQGQFAECMIYASTLVSTQAIQVWIGEPVDGGSPLWTIHVTPVSVKNYFTDSVSSYVNFTDQEEQDIYFYFPDGFDGYLNWFVFSQYSGHETPEEKLHRMQWFTDSRFGHMMHWGAYSVLGHDAWYMNTANIPKDTYIQEACIPFDPQNYDPEYWSEVIVSTGQKYLTITTKHHDGFAMFETNIDEFAPYDVVNTAGVHSAVLRPLAEACRAKGITFCCYYSLLDWGNVNEVAIESGAAEVPPAIDPNDVTRYLSELKEHLKELIEIFDPALMWFDGAWAAFLTEDVCEDVAAYLRRLSPQIIINDRLGGSPNVGDFITPEQSIPVSTQSQLWESCMTINDSWGYNVDDTNWKSTAKLLGSLLDCASKGGNLLLDTGPTADGVIPQPCIDRLSDIGTWMAKWGKAIYGTRAGTLDVSVQSGAYCTVGKDHTAYVTLTQLPENHTLYIEATSNAPKAVYWLDQPQTPVNYQLINGFMAISLPDTLPDELGVVLAMEFDSLPLPKQYPDKALFRSATASNVWFGDVGDYSPKFAIDGDASTRWATDDGSDPVTFEVDLGQTETFTRVTFLQYAAYIGDFTIEARSNGVWTTILQGSKPAASYIGYLTNPVSADSVRLSINSCIDPAKPASLYSFSLFDGNDSLLPVNLPVNLARGAQASASDIWYDDLNDYQASMAIDANPNTRWAANDNPVLPVTFTLGFIKKETFDVVKISECLYSDGSSRIADFTLQILNDDGVTWQDIYHGTDTQSALVLPRLTQSAGLQIVINALTDSGGPSFYEVEVYQTAREPNLPLSNIELLELESRLCFEYFWREANTTEGSPGYGLIAKTKGVRDSAIAGSGFALSALVIAVERNWISRELAQERCQKSLQVIYSNVPQYNGFFSHFINMDTLDSEGSEYSTVDTMLALNGILTAGQYFGDECATLAQQIFDRVDWKSAIAENGYFTMSWDTDFVMNTSTWGGYAEQFCMYPMAAGSTTHAPDSGADMFYTLERKYGHYGNSGDLVYVWDGSLFTYQFSHAWLDFRRLWDRDGTDWWQNSINASQANRQFCIDNSDVFPSFGENDWGLTACHSPIGYEAYGAPPSGDIGANNMHYTDGTITPSGPLGSLPFMSEEVLSAIQHWYQDPRLWSNYGFLESYNLSSALPGYCSTMSNLIKGLTLLMIENYRSNLIWDTYMSHPVLQRGMPVIFDNQVPELQINQSDPAIIYSETNWWLSTGRPQSTDGESMAVEKDDSYFEFTFNGCNVAYYGEKDIDQGDIDFYIDGVYQATASAYADTHECSDLIYAATGLSHTTHQFKGVKRSGQWMTLDMLKVYANHSFEASLTQVAGNTASAVIQLTLTQSADRTTATDISHYTLDNNATVIKAELSQDKKQILLTLSPLIDQTDYILSLGSISNEILTDNLNGTQFIFTFGILAPEILYDDVDTAIEYQKPEDWQHDTGRIQSIFNGTSAVTSKDGDSFSLSFTGTGVAYYTETNVDEGDVEIFIDDVSVATVNAITETHQDSHIVFLKTGLPFGFHTLKGVKKSGTWMLLDALKVYNEGDITVLNITTDDLNNIIVTFNQALDLTSATNVLNYSINGGVQITAASLNRQQSILTLAAEGMQPNQSYKLTLSNISNQILTSVMATTTLAFTNLEGLILWYTFDDIASGVVTEAISGDSSAIIHGAVAATSGKSNAACDFQTPGGYIDLGQKECLQQSSFTVEAWIKPAASTSAATILSQEISGDSLDRWMLYYQNNQIYFVMSNDDASAKASLSTEGYITENAWNHVALICDEGEFKLAINGNIQMTSSVSIVQKNAQRLWIGAHQNSSGADDYFIGAIDEIKIYDIAVTAEKLTEHYRLLADDNYTLEISNGQAIVTFANTLASAPTQDNFRSWIKINDEIRVGLPITSYSYDQQTQRVTLGFTTIPAAAVAQDITITIQYNELPTDATLQIAETLISPPVASSLTLSGDLLTREIVTATWAFSDPASFAESGSQYEWWVGDTSDGTFTQIEGVNTQSLMLLPEHLGKYIKVVVTPRNERFAYGTPVSFVTPQIIGQQVGNPRTDWFMNAKYGISCHFLPNYQNLSPAIPDDEKWQPGETWDDFLSTFDVDAYAQAVADLGAGFVLLTIDQHSGYNLAPSAVYDSILDIAPGVRSPSQRDLPMEIAQALAKYDIKLMFYFMGFLPAKASLTYYDDDANPHSPDRWGDVLATRTFEVEPFNNITTRESTRMHAAVVRSFGEHYQNNVAGFWFDGMYDTGYFLDLTASYNINDVIDGARAGNTQRIITGAGMGGSVYMDFPHGESYGARDEKGNEVMTEVPTSRWEDNDGYHQWFRWIALGDCDINAGWGVPGNSDDGHHYDVDGLTAWVKNATDLQGVVSMDIRVNRFGELDSFLTGQIKAVKSVVYPDGVVKKRG